MSLVKTADGFSNPVGPLRATVVALVGSAQRKRDRGLAVERPRKLVGGLSRAFLALQAPSIIARGQNGADVTLTRFPKLDPRIVLDAKWPSMYRIRLPDGSLSDMLNLTRAKDALALS